jgi:two-component system chemotaxis sensor kinase CheA
MARDPYRYFRIEARELLDQLGKGALELEKGTGAPDLIAVMLRHAHTLKGASRVVKQVAIADRAHAIEDALSPFREPGVAAPREAIEATLKALDAIALRMSELAPADAGHNAPGASPGSSAGIAAPSQAAPLEALTTNVDEMDVLLEGLSEASVQLSAMRRAASALQQSRRVAQGLEEHWVARRGDRANVIGVKLPAMIAQLRNLIEHTHRNFSDGIEQMDRELIQVREAAERLRLLPVRLMFVPLERTARDAASSLGKRIAVATSGGDVRLDAHVFGPVQSALVQVVRNAVAHGIEKTAEREAAGKPAQGQISVQVRRRGHQVVFSCRDDGRGVDLDAVRRAVERQGLPAAEAATLDTEKLLQILLGGGISTSGTITQLAGRGIGLDVVREVASRLRGTVSIRTERGRGTTVEIVVPVTLAALDALIVESGGGTVAIPLDAIKRTLRVAKEDLAESPQGLSLLFDGKVIPFAPLERALSRMAKPNGAARSWSAVVIEGANALAAVGVERLRGTQNLILHPMPELTPYDPIIAGASLDAEGNPQLVLDADGMVEHVARAGAFSGVPAGPQAPILVIDDSLTTRMLEQSILESAGYSVDLASSAEEALERAHKRRYALFLVDVEMPGMDGFTFIERTRADPSLRDIPAILVTSRESPEDRQRGQDVGASFYIVKGDFDQTEFVDKIRLLVGTQ